MPSQRTGEQNTIKISIPSVELGIGTLLIDMEQNVSLKSKLLEEIRTPLRFLLRRDFLLIHVSVVKQFLQVLLDGNLSFNVN